MTQRVNIHARARTIHEPRADRSKALAASFADALEGILREEQRPQGPPEKWSRGCKSVS